jgi:hypothetical protein
MDGDDMPKLSGAITKRGPLRVQQEAENPAGVARARGPMTLICFF